MENKENKRIYSSIVKIISNKLNYDWENPLNVSDQEQTVGTGFFFNKDGFILTAAHVVANSIDILIQTKEYGKQKFEGQIKSIFPEIDLAIVFIPNFKNKYWLTLGDSYKLKIRDELYAIGYPDNSEYPITTTGTMSGIRNNEIQTDIALNPGNSGCPVLNMHNDVIGITSEKIEDSEGSSLIIPINSVIKKYISFMLKSTLKIMNRNVLGIVTQDNLNDNYNNFYGIKNVSGVIVKKILEKSPFYRHINEGDILTGIKPINHKRYNIDNYGDVDIEYYTGKISLSNFIYLNLKFKEKVKLYYYSLKHNKELEIESSLPSYDEVYNIKKVHPNLEKVDYEILGGMIFMDLTLNHLELEDFENLSYIFTNDSIYNKNLIISSILLNPKILENNVSSPAIIKKINENDVQTLNDLRKTLKSPIKKDKNYFIKIEFDNKNISYFNIKELIEIDELVSEKYNYKISEIIKVYKNLLK